MNLWTIQDTNYDIDKIAEDGNRYFHGNGYIGIRGTLEEYERQHLPAINLSGTYDQVGEAWREPLNAPNALFTYIILEGIKYGLPEKAADANKVTLDFRNGIFSRKTSWITSKGMLTVESQRFASMHEKHGIGMKYVVSADFDTSIILVTGIDGDVWDINGPHYEYYDQNGDSSGEVIPILSMEVVAQETKDRVYVNEVCDISAACKQNLIVEEKKILRQYQLHISADESISIEKWINVYTSKDCPNYKEQALQQLRRGRAKGYEQLKREHISEWEKLWAETEVYIEGDDESMKAINYSIYHMHCIAPRHTTSLSIPARGLSGQTYKGAVFWDTEMFMLPFFLYTEPEVARSLVKYRIDTLGGARDKAKQYGYKGAFYAWESQEAGYDACTDYNVIDVFTGRPMRTYFREKQVHISSAIVYGIMSYIDYTGDVTLLEEGGAVTIIECAIFYCSLLVRYMDSERYEIHDVIGPDEYHERVNNNGYTNRMAKFTLDTALWIIENRNQYSGKMQRHLKEAYNLEELHSKFNEASQNLYIPCPDSQSGIIEQFDGYFDLEDSSIDTIRKRILNPKEYWGGAYGVASHTQIIKQADIITFLSLFSYEYNEDIMKKNWIYYEPRTEHGSSLSACMYALAACKCQMADKAFPFFIKSATADLDGGSKQWAGLVYIGGTHPAAAGGAYMVLVNGFAGVHIKDGQIAVTPCLPTQWERVTFRINYQGQRYQIKLTKEEAEIKLLIE